MSARRGRRTARYVSSGIFANGPARQAPSQAGREVLRMPSPLRRTVGQRRRRAGGSARPLDEARVAVRLRDRVASLTAQRVVDDFKILCGLEQIKVEHAVRRGVLPNPCRSLPADEIRGSEPAPDFELGASEEFLRDAARLDRTAASMFLLCRIPWRVPNVQRPSQQQSAENDAGHARAQLAAAVAEGRFGGGKRAGSVAVLAHLSAQALEQV